VRLAAAERQERPCAAFAHRQALDDCPHGCSCSQDASCTTLVSTRCDAVPSMMGLTSRRPCTAPMYSATYSAENSRGRRAASESQRGGREPNAALQTLREQHAEKITRREVVGEGS
jgi:hypothetical protein